MKVSLFGAGNMGGAILSAMIEKKAAEPDSVMVFDSRHEIMDAFAKKYDIRTADSPEEAAAFGDILILADEDPRGEDSIALLTDIAVGAEKEGKELGKDMFIIPDRPTAIRRAMEMAGEGDMLLLLGKAHENSIIFKDHIMPYDEIGEAEKALSELGYGD